MSTQLYLVPTPIGNMEDITLRALRILKEADYVLAEDTRQTKKLLTHYEIDQKTVPFHSHNEHKMTDKIMTDLEAGMQVALVSDAGTPGISDPGFLLARECRKRGVGFTTLPGATAVIPALVNSGLPCEKFVFEGFLPHKKGRKTRLEMVAGEERTVVLFESTHRILKLLGELNEILDAERLISVSRELTKVYEETITDTPQAVLEYFNENMTKGEFVVVVSGK